ncbi:hypothetical protein XENTR_v10004024 [Xenopus tropicalis]|nr:hypothetical protein XENTR_v10004024 [Xenopus tropicalis]
MWGKGGERVKGQEKGLCGGEGRLEERREGLLGSRALSRRTLILGNMSRTRQGENFPGIQLSPTDESPAHSSWELADCNFKPCIGNRQKWATFQSISVPNGKAQGAHPVWVESTQEQQLHEPICCVKLDPLPETRRTGN